MLCLCLEDDAAVDDEDEDDVEDLHFSNSDASETGILMLSYFVRSFVRLAQGITGIQIQVQ